MHRNTIFVLFILAVLAALLVGINIGRHINPNSSTSPNTLPAASAQIQQSQALRMDDCGVSALFTPDFTLQQATRAAQLTSSTTGEVIRVACSEEIPRPPLTQDKIENITIDGEAANLYHDTSAKDGTPLNAAIFKHPQNDLDVGIFGYGTSFNKFIQTVKIVK